jgi:hypothetical protein
MSRSDVMPEPKTLKVLSARLMSRSDVMPEPKALKAHAAACSTWPCRV